MNLGETPPRTTIARWLAMAVLLLLVAAGAFVFVRANVGDGTVRADPARPPEPSVTPDPDDPSLPQEGEVHGPEVWGGVGQEHPPPPDVTPVPGETPDTTKTWWYVPYINADRMKPVYTQTINGMTFGPDVSRVGEKCPGAMRRVPFSQVDDPAFKLDTSLFPAGTVVNEDIAALCDGVAWSVEGQFTLPADPSAGFRGGSVIIVRYRGLPQATAEIPAERWTTGTIAGHPAAIAVPILPDIGLGQSAAAVFVDGVLTIVSAYEIPLDLVLRIAEAQFR